MTEQQLQIKAKPFVSWAIVIFVVCFASLLAFLRHGPVATENASLAWIICAAVSIVAALAGAFLVCGLAAACRGFGSGQLGLVDLIAPTIVLVAIVLFFMGYSLLPKVMGAVELCVWLIVLTMWLVDCRRRMMKSRGSGSTRP